MSRFEFSLAKAEDARVDAISRGVPVPVFYGKG